MRPIFTDWLATHGWPPWLVPDYLVMGGIAGLLASVMILRHAEPGERRAYARALFAAYIFAYAGGTLFELVRSLPAYLRNEGDLSIGRAAWGGLFGAVLAATLAIRAQGLTVATFVDRLPAAVGLIFGFVRIGCFLGGCDYGRPTALPWGVHFPAGSFAATDHAALGWVAHGDASLAVHPTQLYEAAFGFATAAAFTWRRWSFETWLLAYAFFRFLNETLRGDGDRGMAWSLSTAQIVAVVVIGIIVVRRVARWHTTYSLAQPASSVPR